MVRDRLLPPAESGIFISERSHHVKIHREGIEKLCDKIMSSLKDGKLQIPETYSNNIHPNKNHSRAVDWIFVTDALNFCFWSVTKEDQWVVDGYTGYLALEAALHRALKEGYDITNPEYYSKITEDELLHILRGDTEAQIPLLEQRVSVLHEVGYILIAKYHKTFETCVREANKSALKLLQIIVDNFPCFRDEVMYKGKQLSFYKRAQILIADLWNFFDGSSWGEFINIDRLTMFADYRVPQVLLFFGVLSYSDGLMEKLMKDILLLSSCDEEIEIRGCSIHAVELLKQRLEVRIKEEKLDAEVPNSILLDYYLWCYRRKHAVELQKIPYHKTLVIYY